MLEAVADAVHDLVRPDKALQDDNDLKAEKRCGGSTKGRVPRR